MSVPAMIYTCSGGEIGGQMWNNYHLYPPVITLHCSDGAEWICGDNFI